MTMNSHLSESALNELLIGSGSPSEMKHLATCSLCAQNVADFRASVDLFNQASQAWSEERSRRIAPPALKTDKKSYSTALPWALATAVLLVALGIPVWQHQHKSSMVTNTPVSLIASASAENSSEQIAQDNELLRSVNAALESSEEPSLAPYLLSHKPYRLSSERSGTRNR